MAEVTKGLKNIKTKSNKLECTELRSTVPRFGYRDMANMVT